MRQKVPNERKIAKHPTNRAGSIANLIYRSEFPTDIKGELRVYPQQTS